jgi:hypothetical protein
LVGLLRQSVFGRLAGYEDVNDAERLCGDPAMREGFEIDDEILTVFERFEVVWPVNVADVITGPISTR